MMINTMKRLTPIAMALSLGTLTLLAGCSDQSAVNSHPESASANQTAPSATQQDFIAPQISVQLWSVKDALKEDFKGTLQNLADLGFDGVEFAGDFGPYANDPAGLKAYLSSIGLVASGAHVPIAQLKDNSYN